MLLSHPIGYANLFLIIFCELPPECFYLLLKQTDRVCAALPGSQSPMTRVSWPELGTILTRAQL